jgi:hypothetical protein
MNERSFHSTSVLQCHAIVLKEFSSKFNNVHEIDIETAAALADTANILAEALTAEWEMSMLKRQAEDNNAASPHTSTVDLDRPFVLPADVCSCCGKYIEDQDDDQANGSSVTLTGTRTRSQDK